MLMKWAIVICKSKKGLAPLYQKSQDSGVIEMVTNWAPRYRGAFFFVFGELH